MKSVALALITVFRKLWFIMEKKCKFQQDTHFNLKCSFEGCNFMASGSKLARCHVGYGSYIGERSWLSDTKIGKYSCIGPNVQTAIGRHPTNGFVSLHPAFFSAHTEIRPSYVTNQKFDEIRYVEGEYSIVIGNDVWIGAGAVILDGVKIGDGAVVAAGAVVNRNVAPYTIVGGIPAKKIKVRFTDEEIRFLCEFKWWDCNEEWIKNNCELFVDILAFMEHCQSP